MGGGDGGDVFPYSQLSSLIGLVLVVGVVSFPRCCVRLVGWWGRAVGVLQEFTFSSLFKPAPL